MNIKKRKNGFVWYEFIVNNFITEKHIMNEFK